MRFWPIFWTVIAVISIFGFYQAILSSNLDSAWKTLTLIWLTVAHIRLAQDAWGA